MDQWLYQAGGMHVTCGRKSMSNNGFIGVTARHDLVLYDDDGKEYLRRPVMAMQTRFNALGGVQLTIDGQKYGLGFQPFSATATVLGGALGMALTAAAKRDKNDPRTEKQKRQQFIDLINQIQSGAIRPVA